MLVIDYKVISYEYFMDECEEYEIELLSEVVHWSIHQSIEQTRLLMYTIASPYMKNKKDIKNFLPLVTDHDQTVETPKGEELTKIRKQIKSAFRINKKKT